MSKSGYIFEDTQAVPELRRLRALESVFDAGTQGFLLRTGLSPGWRCLEVGAGAGSVAEWMCTRVGPAGRVVALDSNVRFLAELSAENLDVVEGDIREATLEAESFDLVHARFVLIHLVDGDTALRAMLRCLKPGGWIVLEEPDFSASRPLAGSAKLRKGVEHVNDAIEAMFAAGGMDYAFGSRIPSLLQEAGLEEMVLENYAPIERGGSPFATMMRMSTGQLRKKYLATGRATQEDLDRYEAFASDPNCWAIYHATVRGAARRRRLNRRIR